MAKDDILKRERAPKKEKVQRRAVAIAQLLTRGKVTVKPMVLEKATWVMEARTKVMLIKAKAQRKIKAKVGAKVQRKEMFVWFRQHTKLSAKTTVGKKMGPIGTIMKSRRTSGHSPSIPGNSIYKTWTHTPIGTNMTLMCWSMMFETQTW